MSWFSRNSEACPHPGECRRTELLTAARENRVEPVRRFLNDGGQLEEVRNDDKQTLLHVAAKEGSDDALALLLQCPKVIRNINIRDRARRTALHLAAAMGYDICVRRLVQANAAVDPRDERGFSPLHLAVKFEWAETMQALLTAGANPFTEDTSGCNAVDMAQEKEDSAGKDEVVAILAAFARNRRPASTFQELKRCLLPRWIGVRGGSGEAEAGPRQLADGLTAEAVGRGGVAGAHGGFASDDEEPEEAGLFCQCGLELEEFTIPEDGFMACDSCGRRQQCGDTMFGCRTCCYDLCASCHMQAGLGVSPTGAGGAAGAHPVQSRGGVGTADPEAVWCYHEDDALPAIAEASGGAKRDIEGEEALRAPIGAAASSSGSRGSRGDQANGSPTALSPSPVSMKERQAGAGALTTDDLKSGWWRGPDRSSTKAQSRPAALIAQARSSRAKSAPPVQEQQEEANARHAGASASSSGRAPQGGFAPPSRGAAQAPPELREFAIFRRHAHFGHQVKRLELEVEWKAEQPSVGSVTPGGEADRRGITSGDRLVEIAGVRTAGKGRDELLPLLKTRPLLLKVDRELQVQDLEEPHIELELCLEESLAGGENLGLDLTPQGQVHAVSRVHPHSAAWTAGLVEGDAVIFVRGVQSVQAADCSRDQLLHTLENATRLGPVTVTVWRRPLGMDLTAPWYTSTDNLD